MLSGDGRSFVGIGTGDCSGHEGGEVGGVTSEENTSKLCLFSGE